MLESLRRLANERFISRAHPAILEGLGVCLVILEVAQDYARRPDQQFARLVVACDVCAFDRDDTGLNGWK